MREMTVNADNSKELNFAVIVTAAFLGVLSFASAGLLFCVLLTALLFFVMWRATDADDRHFVFSIMILALVARIAFFTVVQYSCFSAGILDIFGDAAGNLEHGWTVRNFLEGRFEVRRGSLFMDLGMYNVHGKTIFNGMFFALFGSDMLSLKYLNILFAVITGWLAYDLAKEHYCSNAGKIAITLIVFWPTIFLWSITDLKDTHLMIFLLLMLWALNKMLKELPLKRRLVYFIILVVSAGYAISLRLKLFLPLTALFLVMSIIYVLCRRYISGDHKVSRGSFIIVFTVTVFLLFSNRIYSIIGFMLNAIATVSRDYYDTGGWVYKLSVNIETAPRTFIFLARYCLEALFHFLTEPLPTHLYSFSLLAEYPVMLVWYLILLLSFIGIARLLKRREFNFVFTFLVFTLLYSVIVGMTVVNIGTTVRFRDAITPLLIIFASCGAAGLVESKGRDDGRI